MRLGTWVAVFLVFTALVMAALPVSASVDDGVQKNYTWLIGGGFVALSGYSAATYVQPIGSGVGSTGSLAEGQLKMYGSYKVSKQNVLVTGDTLVVGSSYDFYRNATADIPSTISGNATGLFTNSGNSSIVSSGDLLENIVTPSGGGSITTSVVSELLSSDTQMFPLANGSENGVSQNSALLMYQPVDGGSVTASSNQTNVLFPFQTTATLKNLRTHIISNSLNGTATFRVEVNSANSTLTVPVTSGATGWFDDTAHTQAISPGDTVNYSIDTTAAGAGAITYAVIAVDSVSAARQTALSYAPGGGNQNSGLTNYAPFEGRIGSATTEAAVAVPVNWPLTIKNAFVRVTSNTLNGGATFTLRKGGVNTGLTMTVGAGNTGPFSDTTHSVDFAASDNISWGVVTAGSSGTIIYSILSFEQTQTLPAVTSLAPSGIAMTAAGVTSGTLSGNVTAVGSAPTVTAWFDLAVQGQPFTLSSSNTTLSSAGTYTRPLPSNLTPGQTYVVRATVQSVDGTSYSSSNQTVALTMPAISTAASSGISMNKDGVVSGNFTGTIASLGVASSTYAYARYGATTAFGSVSSNATETGIGTVRIPVPSNLVPGSTTYYRMTVANGSTTADNSDNRTVVLTMPSVTTVAATNVSRSGGTHATVQATVTGMGDATGAYVFWVWGYNGVYNHTTASQTVSGNGTVTGSISGWDIRQTVDYKAAVRVGSTTVYGSPSTISIPPNSSFFTTTLPVVIAAVIIVSAILFFAVSPMIGMTSALIGLVGFAVVMELIHLLW